MKPPSEPTTSPPGSAATFRYAPADCPNRDHESGMVYDPERDDAVCPLCGTHAITEMGAL